MVKVVVLGAGIGGLVVAKKIRQKLPAGNQVILIEKRLRQYFQPSLYWLMIGERKERDIYRNLAGVFPPGLEFIHDEALEIIPVTKKIILKNREPITYDILVVATGTESDPAVFPDLTGVGHNLHTLEGIKGLCAGLNIFTGGEIAIVKTSVPDLCPTALYEAAILLNSLLIKRGLKGQYQLTIYTPQERPLIEVSSDLNKCISKEMDRHQIRVKTACQFEGIDPAAQKLKFTGFTAPYDLLLYAPVYKGQTVIRNSELGDESGWMPVDPQYLYAANDLFAMGDATIIQTPSGKYLPMMGAVATLQKNIIISNILALATGSLPDKKYKGYASCFFDVGAGQVKPAFSNFYHQKDPAYYFLPAGRWWRVARRLIEYDWLRQGKPIK